MKVGRHPGDADRAGHAVRAVVAIPLTGCTSSEYGDEGSWWDTAPIGGRREFVGLFIDRMTVCRAAAKGGRPTRADPWGAIDPRVEFDWAKAPSS